MPNKGVDLMALRNTENSYGLVTISIHWLTAVLIISAFALGLYIEDLEYAHPWYHKGPALHKSVGLTVFFLVFMRILWHRVSPAPKPLEMPDKELKIAKAVKLGLYGLMILAPVAGYLVSTADGRGVEFFGLFKIPAIIAGKKPQEELFEEVHEIAVFAIMGLVLLHGLAALKHHFIEKDATLLRILGLKKKN